MREKTILRRTFEFPRIINGNLSSCTFAYLNASAPECFKDPSVECPEDAHSNMAALLEKLNNMGEKKVALLLLLLLL